MNIQKEALTSHTKALEEYIQKIDQLNKDLIAKIEALPDNPKIKRLDHNCFTISSKDLGTKNWTPFYYDFRLQYKFLRAVIENYPNDQVIKILTTIMKDENYHLTKDIKSSDGHVFSTKTTYHFNGEVVDYMKEVL